MNTEKKTYLIAGCGYVGRQLAAYLTEQNDATVYALRRSPSEPSSSSLRWLAADLSHGDLWHLPGDLDGIFYTAAPGASTAEAYTSVYQRGLERLLHHLNQAGKPGARLVLTSSTSVYAQHAGEWVDETSPTVPSSPLAQIILQGEAMLRPQDIAVRLAGIYGPGRTSFIAGIRDGTTAVNPNASFYTNRIHRDDAARILAHVAQLAAPERIYIGVDGESATRYEVAAWLAQQLEVPLPLTDAVETSTYLRGHKRCSNQRLVASGYRYLYPSFREGYAALF